MLKIDQTVLPSPSAMTVSCKTITGAGARNTLGQMVRDTLAVKRVISLTWRRLDQATLAALMALTEANDSFSLTYPDPALGESTITCVCQARTMNMERYQSGAPVWSDVTVTLEER